MQVAIIQMDIQWLNKPANHAKVQRVVEESQPSPGTLVVLPEMFATGFSMDVQAAASDANASVNLLSHLARSHRVWVVGGLAAVGESAAKGRNQAVFCNPSGEQVGQYTKRHPMTPADEHLSYDAGDAIVTWPIEDAVVSPSICYDLRFPEDYRQAAARGAEVFVCIANFPSVREHHWVTLLQARAIENQAYVVACNRTGSDPKLAYPGRSMVVDPYGKIIADAGDREGVLTATLDLSDLREYRTRFPVLRDMTAW
jgi:predicted amidohydrolase